MSNDLMSEDLISLADAATKLPPGRGGKRVHISSLLRWILDGAKDPQGQMVRLEGVRLGGRWITSSQALSRFAARLTPALDGDPAPAPRTPGRRERESKAASARLKSVGI